MTTPTEDVPLAAEHAFVIAALKGFVHAAPDFPDLDAIGRHLDFDPVADALGVAIASLNLLAEVGPIAVGGSDRWLDLLARWEPGKALVEQVRDDRQAVKTTRQTDPEKEAAALALLAAYDSDQVTVNALSERHGVNFLLSGALGLIDHLGRTLYGDRDRFAEALRHNLTASVEPGGDER